MGSAQGFFLLLVHWFGLGVHSKTDRVLQFRIAHLFDELEDSVDGFRKDLLICGEVFTEELQGHVPQTSRVCVLDHILTVEKEEDTSDDEHLAAMVLPDAVHES